MKNANVKTMTKQELSQILNTMNFFGRLDGFVAKEPDGKIKFWSDCPINGGTAIARETVVKLINSKLL
jgi:hypothetical protein